MWPNDPAVLRTVTITLRPVPSSDDDSGADPDTPPGPRWPLGDEVATALVGLLDVELRGRGLRWRVVARDRVEVAPAGAAWPSGSLDLAALRELMHDHAKADWPELVEQYVSSLRIPADAHGSTAVAESVAADGSLWDQARGPLRARILAADASVTGMLQRPVADGLVEAVMTEHVRHPFPGGELVSAGDVVGWGVAEHAVFDAARANVRVSAELEAERFAIDGTELVALFGPSHYAATHVLWLSEHLAAVGGYDEANGALVVLPHRHLIAVHPIESAAVVDAAGTLLRFAARQFETCPGPISDQLYWWHDGALHRLPSDSVGETLHVFPSDRFAALLHRLRSRNDLGN